MANRWRWDGDMTPESLGQVDEGIKRAMVAAAGRVAPQAEAWMKINARWNDQTGNARNGLGAQAFANSKGVRIVLYHQVPYGIWLETRWDGRYAVVAPATQKFALELMDMVSRLAFSPGSH